MPPVADATETDSVGGDRARDRGVAVRSVPAVVSKSRARRRARHRSAARGAISPIDVAGSVVVGDPLIEGCCRLQSRERCCGVEEFSSQTAMEPFDLAGRRGRTWLRQQMLNPVLPADAIEEHLHRRAPETAREHFAVIGQNLLGTPYRPSASETVTDPPGALPTSTGAHTDPGMVINAGNALALVPSPAGNPPTTSICHSSIGAAAFPALPLTLTRTPPPRSTIQPGQRPIRRRLRQRTYPAAQFEPQPARTPRRTRTAQPQQRRLHLGRHLMRTRRAVDATDPLTRQGPLPRTGPTRHAPSGATPRPCPPPAKPITRH